VGEQLLTSESGEVTSHLQVGSFICQDWKGYRGAGGQQRLPVSVTHQYAPCMEIVRLARELGWAAE
jgi:hypothetical protein